MNLCTEGEFWLFSDKVSVSQIGQVVQQTAAAKKRLARPTRLPPHQGGKGKGRHIKWAPASATLAYECIRDANLTFAHEADIDAKFRQGTLTTDAFCVFKNKDPSVDRNQHVPLYEAAYKCGTSYIQVQKRHLKQAYANSKRTNPADAWTILPDGTPYWVDRFVFCRQKNH